MNFDHKIFPLDKLKDIKFDRTKKIVLGGGCFDILHYGHVSFIKQARSAGDILVLLLESNEFIQQIKKKEPVHTQMQRAEILAALGYVDCVICLPFLQHPNEDYEQIVKEISPSMIAITAGDTVESQKRKLAKIVHSEILTIPHLSSFSSSQLITYAPILRD